MKRHIVFIISIMLIFTAIFISCREEFEYEYEDNSNSSIDPEPINGISAGYVNINKPDYGVTIDQFSPDGTVVLSYSSKPDISKGSIITVDLDTMGYLRRVLEVANQGNKITLQTEQAYLNDVFVDKAFTLNTDLIPPGEIIDSKSSLEEISKAFTDEKGQFHPVEITYYDTDDKIQRRSANDLISKSKDEDYNIIDFYEDFSNKDLYGKEGDNIHFYIDEGHASLKSDAILDFDFVWDGELDEDTKVKKGDIKFFSFYLDSRAEFMTKLALDMSRDFNDDGDKKLLDIKKVTVKFIVLSVPVWISIDCDVWGAYEFNSTASLNADWGFETIQTLKVGGIYNGETKSFDPIKDYTPQNNIYPLNITGELDAFARAELYPRVEVLIYSFFGPFAEIVPYVEGNYNSTIRNQITPSGSKTFLAWNGNLDVGLDFRIGAKLTFLGLFNKEFGPTTVNCFNNTLWDSPKSLELLTDLPQEAEANSTIPLSIIVKDNLDNPVPFCSVYLSGDGSFSNDMPITDLQGRVNVNWIMDNIPGEKEVSFCIFNSESEMVYNLTYSVTVQGNGPPIADFEASPTTTLEGESVEFADHSTNSPTSWNWNFGDGRTSTYQNPTHIYDQAGVYTVTLTATNNYGSDSETKSNYITIYPTDDQSEIIFNPDLTYGTVSDVDGNTYKTIQIGTQTWMAENLKTTKYNDGSEINHVTDSRAWVNVTTGAYCWYNNDALKYKHLYGALYNWYAVNSNILCPTGWHVPTDEEWTILTDYNGGLDFSGGVLKEIGTSHWISPNTGATNESGFTALPGGSRAGRFIGYYNESVGDHGTWWTSTLISYSNNAGFRAVSHNSTSVYSDAWGALWNYGFSVRCIKNN